MFDPATGETHFLSDLPALIVTIVDDDWASHTNIIERYAGPVELDGSAETQVIAALVSLERAELVESSFPATD